MATYLLAGEVQREPSCRSRSVSPGPARDAKPPLGSPSVPISHAQQGRNCHKMECQSRLNVNHGSRFLSPCLLLLLLPICVNLHQHALIFVIFLRLFRVNLRYVAEICVNLHYLALMPLI